jgi:hypothetical protein
VSGVLWWPRHGQGRGSYLIVGEAMVASSAALREGRGHVLVVVASVSELCLQDRIQSSALSVVTGATGTVQGSCVSETRHPGSLQPQTAEPLWTPPHHTFILLQLTST